LFGFLLIAGTLSARCACTMHNGRTTLVAILYFSSSSAMLGTPVFTSKPVDHDPWFVEIEKLPQLMYRCLKDTRFSFRWENITVSQR